MPDQEIDIEADGAVNDLCDRYADAVSSLHEIYLMAEGYDMHKETGARNAEGFAAWLFLQMPELKSELIRHGVEL